jgi:tRNA/rRNA methyltransferase
MPVQLDRFQVILVAPKIPENIGSVARLLENYSVAEAVLVNPRCEWREGVAQWMATGPSIERLNSLPIKKSLKSAVKDSQFVVGFTARAGKSRQTSIRLEDLSEMLPGKVSLVFGREDLCLLKEEIDVCTHLCALDSSAHFPALNLSHSVAVVLSQLFTQATRSAQKRGLKKVNSKTVSKRGENIKEATVEEQEPVFKNLREMMISVGLTQSGNPDRMLARIKKILQRAKLTTSDLAVLRGLFSSVMKTQRRKN